MLELLRCLSRVSDLIEIIIDHSVIPAIAKVFERIVYDELYSFLTKEDVISKQLTGFRSLHSTVTALLEATDTVGRFLSIAEMLML